MAEGYGLSKETIGQMKAQGVSLLITVDCGISSVEEVEWAKKLGMDVIVTDHHQPSGTLPEALAIINPAVQEAIDPLAGVGVALKVVEAVAERISGEEGANQVLKEYLDLALLGTIADVVPLVGANRFIARYGLRIIEQRKRPGIAALRKVAGRRGNVTTWEISFVLAPRLNAAGRMENATTALELLLNNNEDTAMQLAKRLHSINQQRQKVEEKILRDVMKQAESMRDLPPFAVFFGDDWHPGVIGIVAARVADRLRRPTALVSFFNRETGRGSARSWGETDLLNILQRCSHLLEGLGGHKKAAGFSITRDNSEQFKEAVAEAAESLVSKERERILELEAIIDMKDLNGKLLNDLKLLEPYGEANPQPLFLMREVSVQAPKIVGNNHLKFQAFKENTVVECIGFALGDALSIAQNTMVDLAVYPTLNIWNGTKTLQLSVKAIRPACL
jgi:single-stranded-DNA-specific exonuclease